MSKTTGPILALGAVTVANRTVFNHKAMDWRIPIATGLLAIGGSLVEKAAGDLAEVLAWTALLATLVTRLDPSVPSPVESALAWWRASGSGGNGGGGSGGSDPIGKGPKGLKEV